MSIDFTGVELTLADKTQTNIEIDEELHHSSNVLEDDISKGINTFHFLNSNAVVSLSNEDEQKTLNYFRGIIGPNRSGNLADLAARTAEDIYHSLNDFFKVLREQAEYLQSVNEQQGLSISSVIATLKKTELSEPLVIPFTAKESSFFKTKQIPFNPLEVLSLYLNNIRSTMTRRPIESIRKALSADDLDAVKAIITVEANVREDGSMITQLGDDLPKGYGIVHIYPKLDLDDLLFIDNLKNSFSGIVRKYQYTDTEESWTIDNDNKHVLIDVLKSYQSTLIDSVLYLESIRKVLKELHQQFIEYYKEYKTNPYGDKDLIKVLANRLVVVGFIVNQLKEPLFNLLHISSKTVVLLINKVESTNLFKQE